MNECPHLRPELPPLTPRIASLRVDARGYPVPWFVQWIFKDGDKILPAPDGEGEPEFRIVNPEKISRAIKEDLCWVCGQPLGVYRAYVIGPMCVINRNSAEPPSHVDCAEWSVRGCPFLSRPNMVRREDDLTRAGEENVAGIMIKRNPGVTVIWVVKTKPKLWQDGRGGILFDIGEPEKIRWFKEGRLATNEECIESINTGIEKLLEMAEDGSERNEVLRRRDALVESLRRAN